jgi:hypothetical protein
MKSVMVIITFILFAQTSTPQEITPQTVIEGSKVIMEFIKTFRKQPQEKLKNKENGKQSPGCDICFANHTIYDIVVQMQRKLNDTVYIPLSTILHITKGSEECILQASIGIYRYNLRGKNAADSLIFIRQGEFRVNENEKIQHLIK